MCTNSQVQTHDLQTNTYEEVQARAQASAQALKRKLEARA
jgi:hypothetical protein